MTRDLGGCHRVLTCRQTGLTPHDQVSAGGDCRHLQGVVMVQQRFVDGFVAEDWWIMSGFVPKVGWAAM